MAVAPNSAYLYVAAASTLLQLPRLNPKHRKNYRFGLLVANLMVNIHGSLEKENRKLPREDSTAMQPIWFLSKKNGVISVIVFFFCISLPQTQN